MTKALAISGISQAYRVIKEMNLSQDWEPDYRSASRHAVATILEDRMHERTDRYLVEMGLSISDRRNSSFSRHLLTELGGIVINVPLTVNGDLLK